MINFNFLTLLLSFVNKIKIFYDIIKKNFKKGSFMIFDNIENLKTYTFLNEKILKGFDFILNNDLNNLEDGRYEINDELYANIQQYNTKAEGLFEAHRKYIDIQYIVKGFEKIEVCDISNLEKETEYDEEKDVLFFKGQGSSIKLKEGYFAIFYPQDGHKPCITDEKMSNVKKVVVKILI